MTYFQPVRGYCGSVVWTRSGPTKQKWVEHLWFTLLGGVRRIAASPQEIVGSNSGHNGRLGQNRVSAAN